MVNELRLTKRLQLMPDDVKFFDLNLNHLTCPSKSAYILRKTM